MMVRGWGEGREGVAGTTWAEGTDLRLLQKVAVKVVNDSANMTKEQKDEFFSEVAIMQ